MNLLRRGCLWRNAICVLLEKGEYKILPIAIMCDGKATDESLGNLVEKSEDSV
jgi:hypothetical protein